MIVWGWGRQTTRNYGPALPLACPNCRNSGFWRLERRATWFTLFFVPAIPYKWKHVLLCETCSHGIELRGEQINRAQSLTKLTAAYLANTLSDRCAHRASSAFRRESRTRERSIRTARRDQRLFRRLRRSVPSAAISDLPPSPLTSSSH